MHLLTLLAPAIQNQPADRDVRVITATCGSYMLSPALSSPPPASTSCGASLRAMGAAKLALMTFLVEFNAQTRAYVRKDKEPINARMFMVDPGFARTPGTRSFLAMGSLWGLLVYFCMYPLWWLVLKSPQQVAESFLFAAMSPEGEEGEGGGLYRECARAGVWRDEVRDVEVAKMLWEATEKEIGELEKKGAVERKRRQMEEEGEAKKGKVQEGGDGGVGPGVGVGAGLGSASKRVEEIVDEVEEAKSASASASANGSKKKAFIPGSDRLFSKSS